MNKNLERAKELLPSIILTLLSMVQALALELSWGRIEGSDYLWLGGSYAWVGWLQIIVMLVGMLLIWSFYVSFVLRFTWLPALEDMLFPLLIGLMEFIMIDQMHPERVGPWFLALAAIFATATVAGHLTMRRARQDPDNDYFFSGFAPASWRDYRASAVTTVVLAGFGALLWTLDHPPLLTFAGLLVALLALLHRMWTVKQYWMHSLRGSDRDASNID